MSQETVDPEIDPVALAAVELEDRPAADEATAVAGPRTAARRGPVRRRRRGLAKRLTIVTHRWLSLTLGLALVLITTTGALVLYTPEWVAWTNSEAFHVTETATPVSFSQAMATVDQAHPDFKAGGVNVYRGLYEVTSVDDKAHPGFYGVDPGTGQITGHVYTERGFMAFMNQIHECFFSCEGQPGYLAFLNHPVPTLGMGWLKDVTWAGFILGISALMLLFLGLSGIWLWWPGIKKWRHGFRVRFSKGWYARDYDLHQVIGMAAIPFLLMWGITGANFEFRWVGTAWYFATGGQRQPDEEFTSAAGKEKTPDVGFEAASAAADRLAGPDRKLVSAYLPAVDDATATYQFWYADGFDAWQHGGYPGDWAVNVDRHDAARTHVDNISTAPTLSNQLLDNLGAPMFHYGQSVNGWWRLAWFLFGMTPLVLAITGVSTWLAKRVVRRRRKLLSAARATSAPAAAPAP